MRSNASLRITFGKDRFEGGRLSALKPFPSSVTLFGKNCLARKYFVIPAALRCEICLFFWYGTMILERFRGSLIIGMMVLSGSLMASFLGRMTLTWATQKLQSKTVSVAKR